MLLLYSIVDEVQLKFNEVWSDLIKLEVKERKIALPLNSEHKTRSLKEIKGRERSWENKQSNVSLLILYVNVELILLAVETKAKGKVMKKPMNFVFGGT